MDSLLYLIFQIMLTIKDFLQESWEKILCFFGLHRYEKMQGYPSRYKCKCCAKEKIIIKAVYYDNKEREIYEKRRKDTIRTKSKR